MGLFYVIITRTNALTQAEIGTLSILNFIAATFSLLTGLALPTAITKFASEELGKDQQREAAAIQKTATEIVIILSLAGFAIAAFLSQWLSQYFWNSPEYAFLIILILIQALLFNIITLSTSTLQALYLFGKLAIVDVTFVALSRIAAITFALLGMRVEGVLFGYIIGALIALIAAVLSLRGRFPKNVPLTPLKPLLNFSLPLFLGSLAVLVLNWADVVIIAALTSNYASTGVYYIVIRSLTTLSILWIPIMITIFPTLSAQHGLGDFDGVSNILRMASRYLIYIIVPCCLGLAIISPTALTFFYGSSYAEGAIVLAVLSVATITTALYSLFTTALTAFGNTRQILKINIISAFVTVLLLMFLVPFLETIGATLARLTTNIVILILASRALGKKINIQLDKEAIWKSTIASAMMIPLLLLLEFIIGTRLTTTQTITIEMFMSIGIYTVSLWALKAMKSQDFELLKQAFPKIFGKYLDKLEGIFVR